MSIESKTQQHSSEYTATTATTASTSFEWDTITILQSIAIFVLAALAEIMGGWLIWVAVRGIRIPTSSSPDDNGIHENDDSNNISTNTTNEDFEQSPSPSSSQYTIIRKPWYFALLGSITLIIYGYIPCLQPSAASDGFARIYAAYGGFFIVLSYLLGWMLEGSSAKPDVGDLVGGAISLVGAAVILFWPR